MGCSKIMLVVMDYLSYQIDGKMLIYGMLYPETNKVVLEAVTDGFNPDLSEVAWIFKSIDDYPFQEGKFIISAKEHLLLGSPFSKLIESWRSTNGDTLKNDKYEMKTILKFIDQDKQYNVFEEIVDEEKTMLN